MEIEAKGDIEYVQVMPAGNAFIVYIDCLAVRMDRESAEVLRDELLSYLPVPAPAPSQRQAKP